MYLITSPCPAAVEIYFRFGGPNQKRKIQIRKERLKEHLNLIQSQPSMSETKTQTVSLFKHTLLFGVVGCCSEWSCLAINALAENPGHVSNFRMKTKSNRKRNDNHSVLLSWTTNETKRNLMHNRTTHKCTPKHTIIMKTTLRSSVDKKEKQ